MHMTRKQFTTLALAAAAMSGAWAQGAYPNKTVTFVVPAAAGGTTDISGRMAAQALAPVLGQAVVVDNKGGAGGSIGADAIAKAAPDGYTIGMATASTLAINPAAYKNLPFDVRTDLVPVGGIAAVPNIMTVNAELPAKNMAAFVALAKAQPGKYTFASPGTGSLGHANIENFMHLAGIELLHIPYKGAGQAMTDALAGQVNAMTDNLPSTLPNIQSGKLRPLAVLALKRSPVLPDVPTYAELGYPGMGDGGWFGLVAPAGTPREIVARLNAAAHKAMAMPDYVEKQKSISGESMANTPEQFARQIQAAIERYTAVAKRAHIRLD